MWVRFFSITASQVRAKICNTKWDMYQMIKKMASHSLFIQFKQNDSEHYSCN